MRFGLLVACAVALVVAIVLLALGETFAAAVFIAPANTVSLVLGLTYRRPS